MGISCEINLHQESEMAFWPGSTVSGVIKYSLNQPTILRRITVFIKGKEKLIIDEDGQNRVGNNKHYVNINNVVHEDEQGTSFPAGVHETEFSLVLPNNIPPSLVHKKNKGGYCVEYNVYYYVGIKFEKAGFMKNCKTFKKNIQVCSNSLHTLPVIPTTFEEEKKLSCILCSENKNVVTLKARIENDTIESGGKVELKIEIKNDTDNITIKKVDVKLIEVLSIKAENIHEGVSDVVQSTQLKPSLKNRGDTDAVKLLLDIPSNAFTVRNSKSVCRSYYIHVTAVLPALYRNVVLKVPFDIEEKCINSVLMRVAPPSYWETMNLREDFYNPINLSDS